MQTDFNRAVTLLHHMTYPQARAAFQRRSRRAIPRCAMAQWGIAMTLFQPLWPTRPSVGGSAAGMGRRAESPSARTADGARASVRRRGRGVLSRPDSTDYWQRIARWETAMASVHAAFPEDREASAFYALALLASARPGPHAAGALAASGAICCCRCLRENPNHPGAMHYLIHANDIPGREQRRHSTSSPSTSRSRRDNPHALHMPTHIYTRLGDWDGVIRGNLRAAEAALKYPAGDTDNSSGTNSRTRSSISSTRICRKAATKMPRRRSRACMATPNLEPTVKTAFHLASTRARYALEREDWTAAAALVPREPASIDWDRFPWPEAITWFARGYGAVRTRQYR